MEELHYEDISVGDTDEFGSYTVSKEEITAFAEQYDPQPFHVDEEVAKESAFGGLVASGLQTVGIGQRMMVENMLLNSSARGALGVDNLRWKQPTRPGDTLSVKTEIVKKRPWIDDLGIVSIQMTVVNQNDEKLVSLIVLIQFGMNDDA
ncbi:MaoC family dehydratase [Halocatena halophila]|uniref:MaoC family dehydratase n=1 Tax=Halocatena halophila TaxID=2814576 RepID=UPI002ED0EB7E